MRFDRIPSFDGLLRAPGDGPGACPDPNERRVGATIVGVTAPALALESVRPRLRGRPHQAAAIVSVGGLSWMIVDAQSSTALVAAWV
ncbi:MAG TPA: hypothetical protein VMX12_12055, partial [Acidimicrobiia bacterium]|nr:hypothetical protein [Acidimicrobiia bacterium]